MNDARTQVLYIENDEGLAQLLRRRLKRYGYELEWVADGHSGLARLQQASYDVIAIDYELPGIDGLTILEHMQALDQTPPAIMISGAGEMDTVIAAMKVGTADYIVKTVDGGYMDLLPPSIERVLEKERLKVEAQAAQRALEEKSELLSLTLSSISQGLAVFDSNLCLVTWNDRWLDLFDYPRDLMQEGTPHQAFADFCNSRDRNNSEDALGYSRDELLGYGLSTLVSDDYDAAFYDELWQILKRNGHWRDIIWTRHKEGQLTAQQVMISAKPRSSRCCSLIWMALNQSTTSTATAQGIYYSLKSLIA